MNNKDNSMSPVKAFAAADVAAVSTGGIAGWTWLAPLTELAQLGATVVAIVTGVYAIAWHRARIKELARKRRERQAEHTRQIVENESEDIGDRHK
jgi:dihydroorotate dehydrogenase